jgi:hypothetical protein
MFGMSLEKKIIAIGPEVTIPSDSRPQALKGSHDRKIKSYTPLTTYSGERNALRRRDRDSDIHRLPSPPHDFKKVGQSDIWLDPRKVVHLDVFFPKLQELRQRAQQLTLVKVKSHSGCQLFESNGRRVG